MEKRFEDMLYKPEQFLFDGETIIYVNDGKMNIRWNDGETLHSVYGDVNEPLQKFLDWLNDESK